jgi:carboxylesterase 2
VVTVEYRLGYLGLLCLDDKHCKGNFSVWDIVEALKFVKQNAKAFNGNPNMITVAGQSAGSCLSDLLSLSPVSRDLFQQTILMAGFSENSWAITKKSLVVDLCRNKALKLGFQRTSDCKFWNEF